MAQIPEMILTAIKTMLMGLLRVLQAFAVAIGVLIGGGWCLFGWAMGVGVAAEGSMVWGVLIIIAWVLMWAIILENS